MTERRSDLRRRPDPLPSWERPAFVAAGAVHGSAVVDEAFVWYVVFGDFTADLPPADRWKYRTDGPNARFDIRLFDRAHHGEWMDGWSPDRWFPAARLRDERPALARAIEAAPTCLNVQVRTPDPETLDDLRDAVGLVAFLLDNGAVGVLDPQTLTYFDRPTWWDRLAGRDESKPNDHITILLSPEDGAGDRTWYHTRGMRKFARPDLSVRGVPRSDAAVAAELCNRMIAHQGLGGRFADGHVIRMDGAPDGMVCRRRGSLDDPDFNNVHLEIGWRSG